MLVDKFKEVCDNLGWDFNYGTNHWQNIRDLEDDTDKTFEEKKKYFMLLYKDRLYGLNEFGYPENYDFTGEFVFAVRSNLHDSDYNFKYEEHIKNLETEIEKIFTQITTCDDWQIVSWREIEVSNTYDANTDGIKVTFTLRYTC